MIDYKTVEAVAEKMIADGRSVSCRSVYTELGTGSMSTIAPLVREWEKAQKNRRELSEVEVPEAIALSGEELIAKTWKLAIEHATAGHDAIRRELILARQVTEDREQEFIDVLSMVEAEKEAAGERSANLEKRLFEALGFVEDLKRKVVSLELESAVQSERAVAATKHSEDASERATRAEAQLSEDQTRLRDLGKAIALAQEQMAFLASDRDARRSQEEARIQLAEDRAAKAEGRVDKAEMKADAAWAEAQELSKILTTERAEHAKIRGLLISAQAQLKDPVLRPAN